jgi:hypothetical protein
MRKIAMLVGVVALMSVVVASVALAAGQHNAPDAPARAPAPRTSSTSVPAMGRPTPSTGGASETSSVPMNTPGTRIVSTATADETSSMSSTARRGTRPRADRAAILATSTLLAR